MDENRVCIFLDVSNIYISAQQVADRRGENRYALRIHWERLRFLSAAGRPVSDAYAAGSGISKRVRTTVIKGRWEDQVFERGAQSGKEQAVDQVLQLDMLRCCLDSQEPQTAVLLTGDGKGYEDNVGFQADLERLYHRGWGIELLSWEHSCHQRLKAWAEEVGAYVPLDDYYEQITFQEGGRMVRMPEFSRRPKAVPRSVAPRSASRA